MSARMPATESTQPLLDQLQTLLKQQHHMIKNSDFRGVEALAERINILMAEIVKIPLPLSPEDKKQIESILHQYKKLELMIEAQKDAADKQLHKLAKGKKAVRAYNPKR